MLLPETVEALAILFRLCWKLSRTDTGNCLNPSFATFSCCVSY